MVVMLRGDEFGKHQTYGELVNAGSGLCANVRSSDGADTSDVVLDACDGAAKWEFAGNGQLKLVGDSDLCLSQAGLNAGIVDVASKAAVMATSTANGIAHGAHQYCWCRFACAFQRHKQRAVLDCVRRAACLRARSVYGGRRQHEYVLGVEV